MPELPMWAWIAALAGGGLAIGGVAYAVSQKKAIPAAPAAPSSTLYPGEFFMPGQSLVSSNGVYSLALMGNGLAQQELGAPSGLILCTFKGAQVGNNSNWGSSNNFNGLYAVMQDDGDFVLYSSVGTNASEPCGAPGATGCTSVWQTHTNGNPGAYLVMQNDGNLVVYAGPNNTNPLWSSFSTLHGPGSLPFVVPSISFAEAVKIFAAV